MSGFYRGAVGDSFRAIGVAMVTEAQPQEQPEKETEIVTIPAPTDFALSHQAAMIPCACCCCPGCYDCAGDLVEPCACAPDDGIELSEAAA